MRSVTVNLTTFEPKQSKQQACYAKAQKGVDRELELEFEKRKEMHRETASVDLQKGADGLSFTMIVLSLWACTGTPGSEAMLFY